MFIEFIQLIQLLTFLLNLLFFFFGKFYLDSLDKKQMKKQTMAEKMAETILTARDPHGDHGVLARAVIALSIVRSPPLSA